MKFSNRAQSYSGTGNNLSGNFSSSENENGQSGFSGSDGTNNGMQFPIPANAFTGNYDVVKMVTPGVTIFRAIKPETTSSESPLIRINKHKTKARPYFNTFIKEIAARLSDIEMALDCYDLSSLHFSTHILTELFHDMKMPALYRLAMHMEAMAKENKIQEVKELFREIKKIIGTEVQKRKLS